MTACLLFPAVWKCVSETRHINLLLRLFRQVSATDPDCGVNARVNYTLAGGRQFSIQPDTGDICISAPLDHEKRAVYEFPVIAMDRGQFRGSRVEVASVVRGLIPTDWADFPPDIGIIGSAPSAYRSQIMVNSYAVQFVHHQFSRFDLIMVRCVVS